MSLLLFFGFGAVALVAILLPLFREARVSNAQAEGVAASDEHEGAALAELRDLEFDQRLGKLSEEEYRELRPHLARQAVAELKAIDEARAAEAQRDQELDDWIEREVAALRQAQRSLALNGQKPCPACGNAVGSADRFCATCGAALPVTCPQCHTTVPSSARFCPQCGHELRGPVTAPIPELDTSASVQSLEHQFPPALRASRESALSGEEERTALAGSQGAKRLVELAPASALRTQRSAPRRLSTRFSRWLLAGSIAAMLWAGVAGVLYFRARAAIASQRPIATIAAANYHTLAILPADPNVVFAGYRGGLLSSRDGGATWQPADVSGDAMALAVHPAAPQRVYLAGHNLFLRSDDGGRTWEDVAADIPGRDIHALAVAPDNPDDVYAFIVGQGLWRSANGGVNWIAVDPTLAENVTALALTPGTIYAGTADAGVLMSSNGGATWSSANGFVNGALDSPRVRALTYNPWTGTLYAGTDRGLSFTTNASSGWTRRPFSGDVSALALGPDGTTMLLVTSTGKVYRSRDWGVTWSGD